MSLTENRDQVFLPGGCNRTQNLRFGPYTKRPKIGFQDQLSLNAGQKYCRMLQYFRSSFIKIFVMSILIGCFTQVLLYTLNLIRHVSKILGFVILQCKCFLPVFFRCQYVFVD